MGGASLPFSFRNGMSPGAILGGSNPVEDFPQGLLGVPIIEGHHERWRAGENLRNAAMERFVGVVSGTHPGELAAWEQPAHQSEFPSDPDFARPRSGFGNDPCSLDPGEPNQNPSQEHSTRKPEPAQVVVAVEQTAKLEKIA